MVSILMPIYNGIEFIEESVNSIKKQTFKDWELIIGINGHFLNSEVYNVAKKYECDNIKVYDLINIKGKSNALNKMLEYSKYDWIALLDVDDIWLPNKLEIQIPFMNDYDVIGTQCSYFGDTIGSPYLPFGNISQFNFFKVNPIINSSCLLKKKLCYWEPNNMLEDYDLWLRLRKQNKKFYNINIIAVLHRIHKESAFNHMNASKVPELLKKHRNNK